MNSGNPKLATHSVYMRVAEWYCVGLFVIYAVLLFSHHSMPALADFNDWTYEGVLLRNWLLREFDPVHVLKHYPVPNSAVTLGVAFFALLLPWQIAAKIWLCVVLAVSFFASKHMMHTCRGSAELWLIAPSAVFLNVSWWYGFINFQLGLGWVILISSLLLREEPREWLLGVLLVITFFTHMIPFAFACLLLLLYAVQTSRFRMLWQLVPSAALSLWYLIGRFVVAHNADGHSGMINTVRTFSMAFWAYKVNSWLKSFGFINPGTGDGSVGLRLLGAPLFIFLFVINALLCAAMAWCLAATVISAYREHKKERFLLTAALVFVFFYLVAPGTTLGISDPGSRLLQTVLAVAIFLCRKSGKYDQRILRFAAGCSVLLAAAALFLFQDTVFSPQKKAASVSYLPHKIIVFAHVPEHDREYLYQAIENNDMKFAVWPTGMFLNTSKAKEVPAPSNPLD
jgi:hypothetical protein